MSLYAPFRVRIERDAIVRIYRSLKGKGTLNVLENQQVTPEDIIGTASISIGYRTLNLANLLSVPAKEVQKYIRRSLGQRIFKDELLAYRNSFLGGKKIVVSPVDGVLDFLNPKTGEVRLTFLPKKEALPAGVFGIVEKVDRKKGQAIIRTQASIVYGMFGSGKNRDGILHIISKRDELIGKFPLSLKYEGHILVGGSLVFKEVITDAISTGVSGIITGGINTKDYKGMAGGRLIFPKKLENDIGISIVVCEGFGAIPIGEDIYEMLKKYDERFISIDGNSAVIYLPSFESMSLAKIKSTHLPPISTSSTVPLLEIKIGVKVRIIGNSFSGEQGRIIALDQVETLLPSGVKDFLATVETKRRKIKIPVANLEIIDYSL